MVCFLKSLTRIAKLFHYFRRYMLMAILRIIPNLVTGANLFLGCVAIIQLLQFHFEAAMLCFLLALLADVLDGFLARLFRVSSSLGAQLDSLADAVTSGVLPGLMAHQLLVRYGVKSISWGFSIGSTHQYPLGTPGTFGVGCGLGGCLSLGEV